MKIDTKAIIIYSTPDWSIQTQFGNQNYIGGTNIGIRYDTRVLQIIISEATNTYHTLGEAVVDILRLRTTISLTSGPLGQGLMFYEKFLAK